MEASLNSSYFQAFELLASVFESTSCLAGYRIAALRSLSFVRSPTRKPGGVFSVFPQSVSLEPH